MNGLYSIMLAQRGRMPRPCAIFGGETDRSAARRARDMIGSGLFGFATRKIDDPEFSLRRSTRSEAILLFSYLESLSGTDSAALSPAEIDRMIADRERVMIGFWVMLWEDPRSLKTRAKRGAHPHNGAGAIGGGPAGGGVTLFKDQAKDDPLAISNEKSEEEAAAEAMKIEDIAESSQTLKNLLAKLPEGQGEVDLPF